MNNSEFHATWYSVLLHCCVQFTSDYFPEQFTTYAFRLFSCLPS